MARRLVSPAKPVPHDGRVRDTCVLGRWWSEHLQMTQVWSLGTQAMNNRCTRSKGHKFG